MKKRIIFIQRQPCGAVSIERVFAQIAKALPDDLFDIEFQTLPFGYGPFSILKNLLFFRKRGADVYHITGDIHYIALRLPKKKTVLTIHDLVFLQTKGQVRRLVLKLLFLDIPVKKLDHITVVSQATKDEISSYLPDAKSKIRVIENPLIDDFEPGLEKLFDAACPVILQIGTTKNKNIPNLITALHGLDCKLRIVGALDANIIRTLKENEIRFENFVSINGAQMVEEYRNADIITFCSTYEGFGLPIIEAQAMRKPVITSNFPPMSDVAGDGAVLIDPNNSSSIKDALLKVINDTEYRNSLIELGTKNVKRFDSTRIAKQYSDLYLHILDKQRGS